MNRRLLLQGGANITATTFVGLYNGQDGSEPTRVEIGAMTSTNGRSFTRNPSNPVLSYGTSGAWDDEQVHGPSLLHDGTQYVVYYGGYNGTKYEIGRATSPDGVTWTKYASNPVLTVGAGGSFDSNGCVGPNVILDGSTWHMWYTGVDGAGVTSIGYASSSDGITWTKGGQKITKGSAGQFDDVGVGTGTVIKAGSTWYIYYAGQAESSGASDYRAGYATTTDPAGTYTKQGILSAFSGELTIGAKTYQSNTLRSIVLVNGTYRAWGTAFQPTTGEFEEITFWTTSTDLTTFTTPKAAMSLIEGAWDEISAENPAVLAA